MTVNNNELLPCPFCGGKAKWKGYYTGSTSGLVECTECAACTRGGDWDEAKERWNARAERMCRMEYQTEGVKRGWWKCSVCGGASDAIGTRTGGKFRPPAFCACCGAKVVEE